MKIAVLLGGISPERNVSFQTGKAIAHALTDCGHSVILIDPALGADCILTLDQITQSMQSTPTQEELAAFSPARLIECITSPVWEGIDIAFLGLHGKYSEDGYIQSLLDMRGIRYTGSKMLASAVSMDKAMAKRLFESVNIPTPRWILVDKSHAEDFDLLRDIRKEFGEDIVVKPNGQGSSVGVSIIHRATTDEIRDGIELATQFAETALIEQFIEGREITVSILGDKALPIIEIRPRNGYYDYANKYTAGNTEYICPAEIEEHLADFIKNLAVTAHHVLGCTAYSRVDFRLDEDGQAFCLEVNTLPGFTGTSLVPKAAKAVGMEFGKLCEKIIELS